MDVRVGDTLEFKKQHPCGGKHWLVLRVGMDFKLRCLQCGRELMLPRAKAEKSIKTLSHPASDDLSSQNSQKVFFSPLCKPDNLD